MTALIHPLVLDIVFFSHADILLIGFKGFLFQRINLILQLFFVFRKLVGIQTLGARRLDERLAEFLIRRADSVQGRGGPIRDFVFCRILAGGQNLPEKLSF